MTTKHSRVTTFLVSIGGDEVSIDIHVDFTFSPGYSATMTDPCTDGNIEITDMKWRLSGADKKEPFKDFSDDPFSAVVYNFILCSEDLNIELLESAEAEQGPDPDDARDKLDQW